ncbi:hypothetical protein M422DRAFT_268873 [Sphaerobolus stellatus SS14]|uniref:Uncharacterized protein n=1 Tax=Sphaerobolus stellatus (strain SS14) TaxID=990650 RepID=A0A0C9UWU8_SPHS4|nr:hypothetical protein M422DRAFT_268873 [Sphaerobolus stellatus SS14]
MSNNFGGISIVPEHNKHGMNTAARLPLKHGEFRSGTTSHKLAQDHAAKESQESQAQEVQADEHTLEPTPKRRRDFTTGTYKGDASSDRPQMERRTRGGEQTTSQLDRTFHEGEPVHRERRELGKGPQQTLPPRAPAGQRNVVQNRRKRRRVRTEEDDDDDYGRRTDMEQYGKPDVNEEALAKETQEEERRQMLRRIAAMRIELARRRNELIVAESLYKEQAQETKAGNTESEVKAISDTQRYAPGILDNASSQEIISAVLQENLPINKIMDLKTALSVLGNEGIISLLEPRLPKKSYTILNATFDGARNIGHQIRKARGVYDAHFTRKDQENARAQMTGPISVADYAALVLHKNSPVSVKKKTEAIEIVRRLVGNAKIPKYPIAMLSPAADKATL